MMKLRNRLWIWGAVGLVVVIGAWLIAQQACRNVVNELKGPLTVLDVVVLPDGGSMDLKLQDAEGHTITLSRTSSLKVAPSKQQMHVICWLLAAMPPEARS